MEEKRKITHEPPEFASFMRASTLPEFPTSFNPPNLPPKLTPAPPTMVTLSVRPSACWPWNFCTAVAADAGALNMIRMMGLESFGEEWSLEERTGPQRLNIA